jgi:DNA topoisomerase-2
MDDSIMEDSIFDDGASSEDFAPVKPVKAAKPKAAPKKTAGPAKPKGRPAKESAGAKPKAKAPLKKKRKDDSDEENSDVDMGEDAPDNDESLLPDTPPKAKKAPAPKKTGGKPLENLANESFGLENMDEPPSAKGKKAAGGASSKYQMVSVGRGGEQRGD